MNSYLKLTAAEAVVYNQELQTIEPEMKDFIMQVTNEWTEMGEAKGRANMVTRQIRRRFGELPAELDDAIRQLTSDQLDHFGEALFDFKTPADAQAWLAQCVRSDRQ